MVSGLSARNARCASGGLRKLLGLGSCRAGIQRRAAAPGLVPPACRA